LFPRTYNRLGELARRLIHRNRLRGGAKAAQARHRVADHPQGRRHRHRPACQRGGGGQRARSRAARRTVHWGTRL